MSAGNGTDQIVSGRTILLTGAGGSIGSALAKEIMKLHPQRLLLLDSSERVLYQIDLELGSLNPKAWHTSILGDISDEGLLSEIFQRYHPEIVYHAAAFKHVPLMESNPFAAVRNNALGTEILARHCRAHGVLMLVMISTDKAVNPINIMGASKRIAELVLLNSTSSKTRMRAVRLGNVFGSDGSVVPAFLKQISEGGPITVTHPDVSRYFLEIDEAVDFILLTSKLEGEGDIFVPQLSGPLKISDLAKQLIHRSESNPESIPITFTGLRAGDKMSEEFLYQHESLEPTADARLFRVVSSWIRTQSFDRHLENLSISVEERNLEALIETLCLMIPSYQPTELLRQLRKGSRVEAWTNTSK